jgi:hypothetical protein
LAISPDQGLLMFGRKQQMQLAKNIAAESERDRRFENAIKKHRALAPSAHTAAGVV